MNNVYAERLKAALLARGWTQVDLARKAGLDPGHISRYVNGKIAPQRKNYKKILDALEMTEREFMSGEPSEPDETRVKLMCDVEVLLGLTRKLIDSHNSIATQLPVDTGTERERLLMDATYSAIQSKVNEIKSQVSGSPARPAEAISA